MKVNFESLSKTERRVDVVIQSDEVKDKIENVIRDFQQNAKVKGFRPGKVPRKLIESIYGKQIFSEVSSRLVSDSFENALNEASVRPISRPKLTTDKVELDKDFHYTAEFEVIPEIEVDNYIGIELNKEIAEIKDEAVERVLEQLRSRSAQAMPLEQDRESRKGDFIIIDYEGTIDGSSLQELRKNDVQFILGEGYLITEFEEALIGMRKGELREFDVIYPEDFQIKDAAGKKVKFNLKLKDILERILPDLDDEFAKDLGEVDLESLRRKIREDLERRLEENSKNKLKNDVNQKLIGDRTIDVPQSLLEDQVLQLKWEFSNNFRRQGLPTPELDEKGEERIRDRAVRNIKSSIVVGAIAKKEGLKITDEEVRNKILEISKSLDVPYERVFETYKKNEMLERLRAELLDEKVTEFILDKAIVNDVSSGQNLIDNEG